MFSERSCKNCKRNDSNDCEPSVLCKSCERKIENLAIGGVYRDWWREIPTPPTPCDWCSDIEEISANYPVPKTNSSEAILRFEYGYVYMIARPTKDGGGKNYRFSYQFSFCPHCGRKLTAQSSPIATQQEDKE
jgi:hypothetical protein